MYFDEDAEPASASGIVNCLKLLAEEAASLDLYSTLRAIQQAVTAATREVGSERFLLVASPVPALQLH